MKYVKFGMKKVGVKKGEKGGGLIELRKEIVFV